MSSFKLTQRLFEADLDQVARARGGDRDAQEAIVERLDCIPKLVRSRLRRRGVYGDPALVEDLSQQVFTVIWSHLNRYRGDAPLEGWAYAYVLRTVAARTRLDRSRRTSQGLGSQGDSLDLLPAPPEADHSAVEIVESLLARLDTEGQQLIRLRYLDGLGHAELARRFQCTERAVRARFQRAMVRLREVAARAADEVR